VSKGERTKTAILDQAVQVFSVRGFGSMSMDELTRATGLTKGGIYNHFGSKDDLALQVFDHAVAMMRERFRQSLEGKRTTRTRLEAAIDLFSSLIDAPLFAGGCVLLTTAVEADDTHPALRERAQRAFDDWRAFIIRTVEKGKELGDVDVAADAEGIATVIVGGMEGAILLSKTYGDARHIHHMVAHLRAYLDTFIHTKRENS
jgi:TetR/AcrR family transcriptional regulator, transcriptional repressor for nem operon